MSNNTIYNQLSERMKDIQLFEYSMSILGWDMRTYMPSMGIQQRAQSLALMSKKFHDHLVSDETAELLKSVSKIEDLTPIQKRNLELWQRDYDLEAKLTADFVKRLTEQENITEKLWEKAKEKSDFKMVQPELEKLFELVKEKATLLDESKPMYDVMLDLYEKNMTDAMVNEYFTELKTGVLKLISRCRESADQPDPNIINRKTSIEDQKKLSHFIMEYLKMDPERSRIDVTAHPFTTGLADDVRITTHYLENEPMASFYSVFHESGHALYELNLPKEHRWTRVGTSVSMGIHESQSRFIENIVGKSLAFLTYAYPKIQQIIPAYRDIQFDPFVKAVNAVVPSKIRIYADEVTYNLHIILRFELERELFAGKINISELPQVWNERMDKYLQQKIENDSEGVLQDIHWYGGMLGYFPDYALGNIYNGQMLATMVKTIPDWKDKLTAGKPDDILNWLKVNVHQKGFLYDPADLVKEISGEKPSAKYFVDYIDKKFEKIYSL